MFAQYILEVMKLAKYETLDDGTWYGYIPKFKGVWANEKTRKECAKVLQEVAEEWILLKISQRIIPPTVNGKKLTVPSMVHA
jgi:predicted RNase H-like HicB family nuclease